MSDIDFDHPVFARDIPESGILVRIVTEGGHGDSVPCSWFTFGAFASLYLDTLFEFQARGWLDSEPALVAV